MNTKPSLVEYRRNSSDMDLSSSDDESQTHNGQQNPGEIKIDNIIGKTDISIPCDERSESELDRTATSHSSRVRPDEHDIRREDKSRDDRRENGRRDQRPRDYDRDRREKKRDHGDIKSHDRSSSRRSRERENSHHRHRSRSPGRKKYSPERHRYSPDRRDRKRSHSPEHRFRKFRRSSRSPESFRSKRLERKAARIEKLGLELSAEAKDGVGPGENRHLASYLNPGAAYPASRLTEQIQKRRLLWGAKKEAAPEAPPEAAGTSKGWEAATFKGDNDGKVTEKFKRLMGIKGDVAAGSAAPEGNTLIQKQEEMFSNMEAQYQVARMATHTHRGIGLGFGTFQVPPR